MDKSGATEMMVSIKEFAEFVGVRQSVLRYYDDIGLFSPAERGENNYRYYTLPQIQTIKLIETLRSLNMPLKQIEEIMASRDPSTMVDILSEYEIKLHSELRSLQENFSLIHTLRTQIQSGISQDEHEIGVKFIEERRIALGPLTDFLPGESYHRVFSEYYRVARRLRVNLSYHIGGYFDTFEEFLATPSRPKRFFSLDPNGLDLMLPGNYLVGHVKGDYGEVKDLPDRLSAFAKEHKLKAVGPVYHLYPLNEVCIEDPADYLARISVRLG